MYKFLDLLALGINKGKAKQRKHLQKGAQKRGDQQ